MSDWYGRLLAYVYKSGLSGAAGSVNYGLVSGGFAKVYIYDGKPFRYAPQFLRAQAAAKKAKRGIWGAPCHGDTTKPERGRVY
jgi:micrococcal nuclease